MSTSTIARIENEINMLEARIIDAKNSGEDTTDLEIDLWAEKEQLNFAWQDNEDEYNYAPERQEFNPDGSLVW